MSLARTPPAVIKKLKLESMELLKTLSSTYLKSLENYTRADPNYFSRLNTELRNFAAAKKGRICTWSVEMQKLFFTDQCPVTVSNTFVYRGVASDFLTKALSALKVGDVFEEAGFMSTTIVPHVAEEFRDRDGKRPCCIMVILLPPGIPVLALESITDVKGEEEILLPPGMGLRLIAKREYKGSVIYDFRCDFCTRETRFPKSAELRAAMARKIPICF